jgi:protocatechuate 3,4-dioxygenase beta subunit
MKYNFYSIATYWGARTDSVSNGPKAGVKTICASFALFCLLFALGRVAAGQLEAITVGVVEFQDESGAGSSAAGAKEIARKLAQNLNTAYKDVLARRLDNATDASSVKAMTVEQLCAFGKQNGVKFVVRGGVLASGDGASVGTAGVGIQLYADIISVETFTVKTVRAEGNSPQQDQDRSSVIGRLATLVYQAIGSPAPEQALDQPAQATTVEPNPPGDSDEVNAAESDEELQQLIAEAESMVADGSTGSAERLASLSKALEALKATLKTKAALIEEGKDPAAADQDIAQQKEQLQASLSALAEGEISAASGEIQESQPSGEKKNLLARIDEYVGEALNIIQKIQEMRSALRGTSDSDQQIDALGSDPTGGIPLTTEEATEEVSGVVTEMGEPVAGVTISEPESGVKVETDSNGSYVLPGVAAGRMTTLVLAKSGKQVATGRIDLVRGRLAIADFELKPKTAGASQPALRIIPSTVLVARGKTSGGKVGVLKGVVRDAQGRPAPRALVRLKGLGIARTDSRGQYAFLNVQPGAHQLIVQRSGLRTKTEMVQVAAKKSSESKIQFGAADKIPGIRNQQSLLTRGTGAVLRGVVLDTQKRPLPGAKITVVQQTRAASVLSGPSGKYLLQNLRPGSYRVLVSKPGYDVLARSVSVIAGDGEPHDYQLRKTDSPFIEKALTARRVGRNQSVRNSERAEKDRENPPRNGIINTKGPLGRMARLQGRVSDSRTGKPVSGATVSVQGRPRAKTDQAGNYGAIEVPAGSYQISVSRTGFSEQQRSVRVFPGDTTQENFALMAEKAIDTKAVVRRPAAGTAGPGRGQLRGRIVDANTGRPVSGAAVSIAGQRPVTSDRQGSYAFNDLAPGAYRVIARKDEFLDGIASLVVRPGEITTVNVRVNARQASRVR